MTSEMIERISKMPLTQNEVRNLLYLADKPHKPHKQYYSKYCEMEKAGLTGWALGFAFLTTKGRAWLDSID